MLQAAWLHDGPAAIRYPRGEGSGVEVNTCLTPSELGKGHIEKKGGEIAILNFGVLLVEALSAANNLNATVADMQWVKPLDESLIISLAKTHKLLITLEENAIAGGAGSAVAELISKTGINCTVRHVGIQDQFITHGDQNECRRLAGLTSNQIITIGRNHRA